MAVFASNLCSALPETFDQLLTSDATAAISLSSKVGSRVERLSEDWRMVRKSQVNKSDGTLLRPKARRHPKWTSLHATQVKGDDWFILVTNLAPRVGVHVHLGMEKAQQGGKDVFDQVVEVTMRSAQLPSGPSEHQVFLLNQADDSTNLSCSCCLTSNN
ncbi:hypothetical protein CY35_02G197100 [Sphagnum magellanicum]|nr:hypothetical protein CY35_02G197100 [Sphagnum magellanicum]